MYKNIVRNRLVGEPVVIGARPKPVVVEEEPDPEKVDDEPVKKDEPQPERGIPQEVLDKVYAEIEEIEQKLKQTDETLHEAHKEKAQSTQLKKQAEEMKYRSNLLSIEVFPLSNTLATIVTQ